MKTKVDIDPVDKDGHFNGYQQWYNSTNKTLYRGIRKHGLYIGYQEWHSYGYSEFYIK